LVLERVGQLAQAERATAQAIRNERDNWELWLILGRVRAERGRLVAALAAVREARRLNPRSPLFARGVARRLAGAGG
jgi:Flp pilus assembly protein TadD